MTFIGTPNLLVRLNPPIGNLRHIRFDGNGHFSTENPRLIKRLEGKFDQASDEFKCKKCDFATNSKGELMRHYKAEHPKEG
jgi:hypothetical protein